MRRTTPLVVALLLAGALPSSASADPTITSHPGGFSSNGYISSKVTSPSFSFSDVFSPFPTFECKLGSGDWETCTSPKGYSGLTDGIHTFSVRTAGVPGTATFTWRVDTTPPTIAFVTAPAAVTASTSASFTYTYTDESGPWSILCSLDGGSWQVCEGGSKTFSGLAEGNHTLDVNASDMALNNAPNVRHSWRVDLTGPDTSISAGPAAVTSSPDASIAFSSAASDLASFECSVDSGTYSACTSPLLLTGLADGDHTVAVRGKDAAGNVDATPATRSWKVDAAAPDTSIVSGPPALSGSSAATYDFSATEAPVSFECSRDGGPYAPCTDPTTLTGFDDGAHTVAVRAVDAAGNVDPTPASSTWTVDTVAPDTTIDGGPSGSVESRGAAFSLNSTDVGAVYECRLDDAAWALCASPVTYADLPVGARTFEVRARDAAGNADATPASRTWTIVAPASPPSPPAEAPPSTPALPPETTPAPAPAAPQAAPAGNPVTGAIPSRSPASLRLTVGTRKLRIADRVPVTVALTATTRTNVRLVLRASARSTTPVTVAVAPGGRATARLALTSAMRTTLRTTGRLRVTVVATALGGSASASRSATLVLRR